MPCRRHRSMKESESHPGVAGASPCAGSARGGPSQRVFSVFSGGGERESDAQSIRPPTGRQRRLFHTNLGTPARWDGSPSPVHVSAVCPVARQSSGWIASALLRSRTRNDTEVCNELPFSKSSLRLDSCIQRHRAKNDLLGRHDNIALMRCTLLADRQRRGGGAAPHAVTRRRICSL
jgi:hypothetical protein